MKLDTHWHELDVAAGTTPMPMIVRRVNPDSADSVFVGLRKSDGTRLLFLQLSGVPGLSRHALVQSRGFRTHLTRFEGDPEGSCNLVIESTEPSFNQTFTALVDQVLARLQGRDAQETAISAFLSCLHDWKRFFDSGGMGELSTERVVGLFGEIMFLRDFPLRFVTNSVTAVTGWVGPDPLCKDFQYSSCAIEVKTVSRSEPVRVVISDERQLDDQGFPALFLFALLVERSDSAGTTLPRLIDDLRRQLGTGSARSTFEDKLLASGYHDIHREHYELQFVIHEHRLFRIIAGFPRLTASVPLGVGDVRYTVTLAACSPFSATDDTLARLLTSTHRYDA